MCVPKILHCNGVKDCDDGTDEIDDCSKCHRSNVLILSFSSCLSVLVLAYCVVIIINVKNFPVYNNV